MSDEVQACAALVVATHDMPRRVFGVRGLQHLIPSARMVYHLLREGRSIVLNFYRRSGSSIRASKRRFCSSSPTSSQNLMSGRRHRR